MKQIIALCLLGAFINSCQVSSADTVSKTHDLGWIVGCWENETGQSREVWAQEADLLLGYSVDLKDDKIRFFEQMRIVKTDHGYDFIVSPYGGNWVTFQQKNRDDTSIVFVNANNDYPQRIRYVREGLALNAEISALDGRDPTPFNKTACD